MEPSFKSTSFNLLSIGIYYYMTKSFSPKLSLLKRTAGIAASCIIQGTRAYTKETLEGVVGKNRIELVYIILSGACIYASGAYSKLPLMANALAVFFFTGTHFAASKFFLGQVESPKGSPFEFKYDGVRYFRGPLTVGDGACALHALLGKVSTEKNGQWFYAPSNGASAKTEFMDKLQDALEHLGEWENEWNPSQVKLRRYYARSIWRFLDSEYQIDKAQSEKILKAYHEFFQTFEERFEQAKKIRDDIYLNVINDPNLYDKLYSDFQAQAKKSHSLKEKSKENLLQDLRENRTTRDNFFGEISNSICKLLEGSEAFKTITEKLKGTLELLDEKPSDFWKNESVFEFYRKAVCAGEEEDTDEFKDKKSKYQLSAEELELAAYLYEKRVILFSDSAPKGHLLNPGAPGPSVAIWHEGTADGGHYSRLQPVQ